MPSLAAQIDEAAAWIRQIWECRPSVGIILGTGLGSFTEEIQREAIVSYEDIPHLPRATALGHKGQLVCGNIGGVPVVTMEGRYHMYEGYSLEQITLPVRVMKELGIELLIVSNASGGLNPNFRVGDIMVIEDHINLMFDGPLVGTNDDALGARFPDMSAPYDPPLARVALQIARREDFVAHRGVYVAVCGPNYETRAEYRFLRRIGGDVVGMSTVPEVIVAAHAGLRVLALSAVTNVCRSDALAATDGAAVIQAARSVEGGMRKIVLGILANEFPSPPPGKNSCCADPVIGSSAKYEREASLMGQATGKARP
jgi:purine-nucleoside phosphorylase